MAACFVADKWISPCPVMHACGSQSRKDHVFKPKILLVNDHPASLMALKSLLIRSDQENDYEVVTAQSGEEALRHVLHQQFAVILLDVSMPGMDGFEVDKNKHTQPQTTTTPNKNKTTQKTNEMNRLKGYQKGAVDYL